MYSFQRRSILNSVLMLKNGEYLYVDENHMIGHVVSGDIQPDPYVGVWGRLEASLSRPVFYELVDLAVERQTPDGAQLGVWANGQFYPLGPAGSHDV